MNPSEKASRIYKAVDTLCNNLPVRYQEEVRTKLIYFGLKIRNRDLKYIFICLRNEKIDIVKVLHKQSLIFEPIDSPDGTADCEEQLDDVQDLASVFVVAERLTEKEKSFLIVLVDILNQEGELNVVECSKRCKISRRRGYQLINKIREIAKSTWRPEYTHGINNLNDLYIRLTENQ